MLFVMGLLATAAAAQTDLDLLQSPASPAYVLLGVEPASVERPGDPTDLAFSLLTATETLSVLPQNYAVSFAPYWLAGAGQRLTFDQWRREGSLGATIMQTLDISLAAASRETDDTSLGAGLRFSLRRGTIPASAAASELADLEAAQRDAARDLGARLVAAESADSLLIALEAVLFTPGLSAEASAVVESAIAARRAELVAALEPLAQAEHFARLSALAAELDLRRLGFKLDVAGGITGDFPQRDVDQGRLARAGAWLTGGYDGTRWTALGVARWMTEDNAGSWDAGGRVIYAGSRRFAASIEGLGRWYTGSSPLDDTWRATLIVDYKVAANRTLSFSFGRDFAERSTGNLIAAVQLLLGFGAARTAS
jgi:hypothetical protein